MSRDRRDLDAQCSLCSRDKETGCYPGGASQRPSDTEGRNRPRLTDLPNPKRRVAKNQEVTDGKDFAKALGTDRLIWMRFRETA